MHIGCPKEVKPQEYRIGLTSNVAQEAINHGHQVTFEPSASVGQMFWMPIALPSVQRSLEQRRIYSQQLTWS